MTFQLGLDAHHSQTSKTITDITDTYSGGVCILDFDNDGWEDIFHIGGSGNRRYYGKNSWWSNHHTSNSLWKNVLGKQLLDVTQKPGLKTLFQQENQTSLVII